MANYTTDESGRRVIAVGAPGSPARLRVERPALVRCARQYRQRGADRAEIDALGVDAGLAGIELDAGERGLTS